MTTITLYLDWLSNEVLAVLLNQLIAAGDAADTDDDIDESEIHALDEAYIAVQEYLDARVGEDEAIQLQTDLDGDCLFLCDHCGATLLAHLPIPVEEWLAISQRFQRAHLHCPPPAEENQPPLPKTKVPLA